MDWLRHNDVRLYFDLKLMRIQGKTYCKLEEDIHIASTVRMQHTEILKPNSAKVCYGKVRQHPDLNVGSKFEVSQIDRGFIVNEPGLTVINSVSQLSKNRTVPLLIVNNTNKMYNINRHGLVARVSSVEDSCIGQINSNLDSSTGLNRRNKPTKYPRPTLPFCSVLWCWWPCLFFQSINRV